MRTFSPAADTAAFVGDEAVIATTDGISPARSRSSIPNGISVAPAGLTRMTRCLWLPGPPTAPKTCVVPRASKPVIPVPVN